MTVVTGYEPVAQLFKRSLGLLGSGGGAFCAYVEGQPVVDVWGGSAGPGRAWAGDTLTVIMSATKGLSTMCVQILADRGHIDVDEPVATYWPEFAQAGKEGVLVRHVLTHTAGVFGWADAHQVLSWDGSGWDDHEAIAAGLAASPAEWAPGERFGYHAISYGWLTGELVRRVAGVSIGTFWRREVGDRLGVDAWIGTPTAEQPRVAQLSDALLDGIPRPLRPVMRRLQAQLRDPSTLNGKAFIGDGTASIMDKATELFAVDGFLATELPGGNGTATARGLARAYAVQALDGELEGQRLLSKEIVEEWSRTIIRKPDELLLEAAPRGLRRVMGAPIERSMGYLVNPKLPGQGRRFGPSPRAYGHDGAGGQIAFADREARISVGFVRNQLTSSPKISNQLIAELYRCAGH